MKDITFTSKEIETLRFIIGESQVPNKDKYDVLKTVADQILSQESAMIASDRVLNIPDTFVDILQAQIDALNHLFDESFKEKKTKKDINETNSFYGVYVIEKKIEDITNIINKIK